MQIAQDEIEGNIKRRLLLREVNEEIHSLVFSDGAWSCDIALFLCECSRPDCSHAVELSSVEFAAARAHPSLFLAHVDHADTDGDAVVIASRRYAVVEATGRAKWTAEQEALTAA